MKPNFNQNRKPYRIETDSLGKGEPHSAQNTEFIKQICQCSVKVNTYMNFDISVLGEAGDMFYLFENIYNGILMFLFRGVSIYTTELQQFYDQLRKETRRKDVQGGMSVLSHLYIAMEWRFDSLNLVEFFLSP